MMEKYKTKDLEEVLDFLRDQNNPVLVDMVSTISDELQYRRDKEVLERALEIINSHTERLQGLIDKLKSPQKVLLVNTGHSYSNHPIMDKYGDRFKPYSFKAGKEYNVIEILTLDEYGTKGYVISSGHNVSLYDPKGLQFPNDGSIILVDDIGKYYKWDGESVIIVFVDKEVINFNVSEGKTTFLNHISLEYYNDRWEKEDLCRFKDTEGNYHHFKK